MRFPYPGVSEWFLSLCHGEPCVLRVVTHTGLLPRQPQRALCHHINQMWKQVAYRSEPRRQWMCTPQPPKRKINQPGSQGCQPAPLPLRSTNCAVLPTPPYRHPGFLGPWRQSKPVVFGAHPKQRVVEQARACTSGRSEVNSVAQASAVKADFSRTQRPKSS